MKTRHSTEETAILCLHIGSSDRKGNELFFQQKVVIGRSDHSDISIQEVVVSRLHVEFYLDANSWHIRDLNSKNGTWLEGQRIDNQQLTSRGTIVLGTMGPQISWQLQSVSNMSDSRMHLFHKQLKDGSGEDSTLFETAGDS